jgi:hypothetical protein
MRIMLGKIYQKTAREERGGSKDDPIPLGAA